MRGYTQGKPIKCGDHDLNLEVTITERLRDKAIDGQKITLKEPPVIIAKCATCGRETATHHFTIDVQLLERIFP
jgi:hypothetical protein